MGSNTKYKEKELVSVPIVLPTAAAPPAAATTGLIYCFWTNIPTTDRTELGHTAVANPTLPAVGSVLGATFPKPKRASKRNNGLLRFTSSFISKDKIDAARIAGWRVSKSARLPKLHTEALTPNAFVRTVYVSIRGIKYAYDTPKVTLDNVKGAGKGIDKIGLKEADASDADELCFGANAPKPPKAAFTFALGGKPATVQTFFDPDKALVAPWQATKAGVYSFA